MQWPVMTTALRQGCRAISRGLSPGAPGRYPRMGNQSKLHPGGVPDRAADFAALSIDERGAVTIPDSAHRGAIDRQAPATPAGSNWESVRPSGGVDSLAPG